jgi:hypothetical protein
MYQRDMDLLSAYNRIDRLEKTRSALVALAAALGAGILALSALFLWKLFH